MYTIQNRNFIVSSAYLASVWVVHDQEEGQIKRLQHHIKGNDYFGTLATILDLMDQITDKKIDELVEWKKEKRANIKKLKSDLLYLQKNYRIIKKK